MTTKDERDFFDENGYLIVRGVLGGEHLARIQQKFDEVWAKESAPPCQQYQLLKYQPFIELIEHAPILSRHQAIFGRQTQLLQYDLLKQGPRSTFPVRAWHRDFTFPGDRPLSINTLLYLDPINAESGPTYVVPGSHRGSALPPADGLDQPLQGEVAVHADPGDAVLINSAIWHSGGRNRSDGLRRGIYLYYGYWWLKRYNSDRQLPWQVLEQASDQRLRLLGLKMPDRDLHIYDPTVTDGGKAG